MVINKLNIIKYKHIENFQVSFSKKFNLIIGENNSGKTSILKLLHQTSRWKTPFDKFTFSNIPGECDYKKLETIQHDGIDWLQSKTIKMTATQLDSLNLKDLEDTEVKIKYQKKQFKIYATN